MTETLGSEWKTFRLYSLYVQRRNTILRTGVREDRRIRTTNYWHEVSRNCPGVGGTCGNTVAEDFRSDCRLRNVSRRNKNRTAHPLSPVVYGIFVHTTVTRTARRRVVGTKKWQHSRRHACLFVTIYIYICVYIIYLPPLDRRRG